MMCLPFLLCKYLFVTQRAASYKLDELQRHHLRQQLGTEELAALCSRSEPSSPPLVAYRSPQAHS